MMSSTNTRLGSVLGNTLPAYRIMVKQAIVTAISINDAMNQERVCHRRFTPITDISIVLPVSLSETTNLIVDATVKSREKKNATTSD